ncbi:MAG: toll/interleukin-1 receptor domain-containing protein [Flavobacteriales bacterium]|nr:toll/interleukin-1 receptor domain-containing protein [Flavobacteriales bacterium]
MSKKLAEEVRVWLPGVLQFVKPYFTPNDIEKGTRWSTEIANELESSNAGIICLTKDNLNKPWILFEAGALSKNFGKANVCTILFNVDSADLSGPLTSFQATKFDKADFKKLLITVNNTGGDSKLEAAVLNDVFEMWWPKLEAKVQGIISTHKEGDGNSIRSDREVLEEVLELTRINAKRGPRRGEMSRDIVLRLMEVLSDMQVRIFKMYGSKQGAMFSDEMRRPIKHLCMEYGEPEMYERFLMLTERFMMKDGPDGPMLEKWDNPKG